MTTNQHYTDTYSSNKTYEIAIWTIAFAFFILFASNLSAATTAPDFKEENYIDDIPFDTELIYNQLMEEQTALFSYEEETYIDDIPFDTQIVVLILDYAKSSSEETVNDIPFNTEEIAADYYYTIALNQTFKIASENYINDIPFDTFCIAYGDNDSNCQWFAVSH